MVDAYNYKPQDARRQTYSPPLCRRNTTRRRIYVGIFSDQSFGLEKLLHECRVGPDETKKHKIWMRHPAFLDGK